MITDKIRTHFFQCTPYSSARDEFRGEANIYLDANESFEAPLGLEKANRYPDPFHLELRKLFAKNNDLRPSQIFFGNGSDEAIDLLIRLFCEPGRSAVLCCRPTYGMYAVSAQLQNVRVVEIPLDENFNLCETEIIDAAERAQVIFLCNPNNPTGTLYDEEVLLRIARAVTCPVVIDEAYIQFSGRHSCSRFINECPNLIILQTFSKAWGIASLRVGVCIAHEQLISFLYRIKSPYNVSGYSQRIAAELLAEPGLLTARVVASNRLRDELRQSLKQRPCVEEVFDSAANFLLVRFFDAAQIFGRLLSEKIVVRNRSAGPGLSNCLRITVGSAAENDRLIRTLSTL